MLLRSCFIFLFSLTLFGCGGGGSGQEDNVNTESTASSSGGSVNQLNIAITRTTGEVPFHIYVSSSESTSADIDHPYDEIEYSWNFGAPSQNNSFTHPVTLSTVSANSDQTGPEASFVYRNPGTYTITLTARKNIEGVLTEEHTTMMVTASAWSGETRYFDPDGGNDTFTGETESAPKQTWDAIVTWLTGGDHRRALIQRGSVMPVDSVMWLSSSNIRLGAYGTGVKPILRANTVINNFVRLAPVTDMSDHVYSDLAVDGNNGNALTLFYSTLNDTNTSLKHIAFIDMAFSNDDPHDIDGSGNEIIQASNLITLQNVPGNIDDVLVWNSTFTRNHGFKNGIYAEIKGHFAVMGGSFSGGDGNAIKDHPIYPAGINHALYRWIDFQATYSNNFSINNAAKGGLTNQFTLVDGCDITGGQNGLDFTRHNSSTTGWFDDVILQNNAFHDLGSPGQGYGLMGGSLERITIRDNIFYGTPLSDIQIIKDDGDASTEDDFHEVSLQMYRNKFWKSSTPTTTLQMLDFQQIKDINMSDNIFVNDGVTGGSTNIATLVFPETYNWIIDNNTYWSPGISHPFKQSGVDSYSFAGWQALGFDINGSNTDPQFTNPANGVF